VTLGLAIIFRINNLATQDSARVAGVTAITEKPPGVSAPRRLLKYNL